MKRYRLGLALVGFVLVASGFDWVGETDRLARELRVANVTRRREIVRLLAGRDGDHAKQALIAALGDENPDVRREAMEACANAGFPEAWPALAALVVEGNAETRATAARGLGRSRDATFVPVLVRALGDAEAVVRVAALSGLALLGDPSVRQPIESRLDDDDARVRAGAASALESLGSPLATPALVSRIADDAPEVRLAVVRALGRLADASAVPALEVALEDESEPVRVRAAIALARMTHPRVVAILAARVDGSTVLARTAASALAQIGSEDAVAALVAASLDPRSKLVARAALLATARRDRATAQRVALAVARALTEARGAEGAEEAVDVLAAVLEVTPVPEIADALVRALEHDDDPSPVLLAALGRSGGESALVPLLALATSGSPRVRPLALEATATLLEIRGPDGRVADPVLAAITRATEHTELAALARVLGYSGAERSVAPLLRLSEHEAVTVRSAAFEALGRIGSPLAVDAILVALRSTSEIERRAATRALARALDPEALVRVLGHVSGAEPVDRVAMLEAVTEAMPRMTGRLDAATGTRIMTVLRALLATPRGEIAALALEVLARMPSSDAPALLREAASTPSPARAEALSLLALGSDAADLAVLRDAISEGDPRVRAAAVVALGERGTREDLARLVEVGTRGPWNVTLASSFALARLVRRGVAVVEDADALCGIGLGRDPVVAANLLVARSVLGKPPCRATNTFDPVSEPFVRVAQVHAARGSDADLNALCASPLESIVRAACEREGLPDLEGHVAVTAFDADGRTPLASRLVAVAFADGTVLPALSSRAARVVLDHAPSGPMMLFDPSRTSLER